MFRLIYTNEYGDRVAMGGEAPLFFLSQQGMDGTSAQAILSKGPFQKGKTRLGVNVDQRVVTVNGALVTESRAEFETWRAELLRAVSPLVEGTLTVMGETIERAFTHVQVVEAPVFDDRDYNRPDGIVYFNFSVVVPGNFAEDVRWTSFSLAEVAPMFGFPLVFETGEDDGTIIFGNMTVGRVHFYNRGDVEAPVIVEIPGPVQTPMIVNETTGEFIRVHTPIMAHERMIINTGFGSKAVVIADNAGQKRNAFHYIDLDSAFFQLAPGENRLRFRAEAGNDTATVTVRFKQLYLGV